MSEDVHTKLLAFLAGAFAFIELKACIRIELQYAQEGGYRPEPLKVWSPEVNLELFSDRGHVHIERLVVELVEIAENHADSYGRGRHRFIVRAHQHMGGRTTHAFHLLPSSDGDETAIATTGSGGLERPTHDGLVGQLMRHLETRDRSNEKNLAMMMGVVNHHAMQMREENTELRAEIAKQRNERVEWITAIEEAKSTEHTRQIEALQVTAKEERKTLATTKIVNLFPVLISKVLGSGKASKGAANKPPSPLAQLVGKLADSLTDDQKDVIGSLLTMEQQIAFSEIVDVVHNGDSALLPAMLSDLMTSLQQPQIVKLMQTLDADQQKMFAQAVQLAQAQANQAIPPKKTNGTTTATPTDAEAS